MARREFKEVEKRMSVATMFMDKEGMSSVYYLAGRQDPIIPSIPERKPDWKYATITHAIDRTQIATLLQIKSPIEARVGQNIEDIFQEIIKRVAELEKKPSIYNATIFDVEGLELQNSISIVLEAYPTEFIARFPEVEVFGIGVTESDAIRELKKAIVELYTEVTSAKEGELGPLPLSWLRVFNRIIKAKN